jgi:hypothetical protein
MKKLIALVSLFAAACGGSAPTAPTAPTTPVIAAASIAAEGPLTFDTCDTFNNCSAFHFSVTNNGPGCANATTLVGDVMYGSGVARWTLTTGEKLAGGGTFRPGETRTATENIGQLPRNATGGYAITITKLDNVACQ